jgi:hypothetical protein
MIKQKISLEEFLGKIGLVSPISDYMDDKLRHPHGLTARQRKTLEKNAHKAAKEYSTKRQEAIYEYNEKIKSGEFEDKSHTEKIVECAKYGHPDNIATQAARRICKKRGLRWVD